MVVALTKAFNSTIKERFEGWELVNLKVGLQTDGWNCGVWIVVLARAFAAYVESSSFGGGGFGDFVIAWIRQQQGGEGVCDLNAADTVDTGGNVSYVEAMRVECRDLLYEAAVDDKLSYTDGPILDVFVVGKAKEISDLELAGMDGE